MDWRTWYDALEKPAWTPEPATIGLIWNILYPIMAVSFGFVLVQALRGRLAWPKLTPFAINLLANLAFTPILFALRNLWLAAVDVLLVWATIVWIIASIWSSYRWVALAQVPYLAWVSIASVLQLSITWFNRM